MSAIPGFCIACQVQRVAWSAPRVDYCYRCLPGGPFTPPPCTACGNADEYFSQGLCAECHPASPKARHSCRDCLAWGVLAAHSHRCWGCRGWRARYPVGQCPYCERTLPLGVAGACRLCWRQGLYLREGHEALDLPTANRAGQQLYLANLEQQRAVSKAALLSRRAAEIRSLRERTRGREKNAGSRRSAGHSAGFTPVPDRQYPLFWMPRDTSALMMKRREPAPVPAMDRHLHQVLAEHAARHGWSVKQTADVHLTLRSLQACQDTPGAAITASEVQRLRANGGTVQSTLEVLAAAGLLEDDRTPQLRRLFERYTADLSVAMTSQLETWYRIMTEGSTRPPRRKPRHPGTVKNHIVWMTPALRAFAADGFDTLAAVEARDVLRVLPASGVARTTMDQGLRSLFSVLKSQKLIFANPMGRIPSAKVAHNIPLPLDTDAIRAALDDPDPAKALAVALVAFHALTLAEIHRIQLTDLRDGHLHLGPRRIPLAAPVRVRLAAYLDHRARRWPDTLNPHLLINNKNAPRTRPVGPQYPWAGLPIQPQELREDRILHEIHATGGDVRRICDLFGMSVDGALRYTTALEHPELRQNPDTPGTPGS